MGVTKELFGKLGGKEVYRYWIENGNGMKAGIIDYGAILTNLIVPGPDGEMQDVVLGYDTPQEYAANSGCFGAVIGPNANRIGKAAFELEGRKCQLAANNGENNLHSHPDLGYHKRMWEAEEGENSLTLRLEDQDGCMGFPGNKKVQVTYTLTGDNGLVLKYGAESDRATIINMTNHAYFNLAGHDKGKIYGHILELKASSYTPTDAGSIPTGQIAPVAGTPFDFLTGKRIGDEIDSDDQQLRMAGGYDHNFVIDGFDGTLREIATVAEPVSGRRMKVYTDLPGVQFYSHNSGETQAGKGGAQYGARSGLCLETQYFPDTPNKPGFPSDVFGPGRKYESTTIYKFC